MISIIAALTKNRMIGKDNDFPWHLADDLKRFKELTTGHPIIMGKNSFDHLLHRTGGKLLPNRISIVVTRDRTFSFPGAIVAHSIEEAIDATDSDEVFIIGGGQIFTQSLDLADKLLLTQI
ncbi:hypothetical protein CYG49_03345, partial [Candidatus Saccharibacteria bacterium]